jgi:hypothetical protein
MLRLVTWLQEPSFRAPLASAFFPRPLPLPTLPFAFAPFPPSPASNEAPPPSSVEPPRWLA